jgi:hypothetical protein
MKYLVLIFFFTLSSVAGEAQNDARVLLRHVFSKLQQARDYTANANITVNMPHIRIQPIDVKIYFKQKDKLHVESKSIAILPRQGFDHISKLLSDTNSYTAMIQGEESFRSSKVTVVNVIPLSDTSDVILAKFWIDPSQSVVMKSQLTTRSSGTIQIEYAYGKQIVYGLPDKMQFTVDIKKFRMPKKFSNGVNTNAAEENGPGKEANQGIITIVLSNYLVNKGIPDSILK